MYRQFRRMLVAAVLLFTLAGCGGGDAGFSQQDFYLKVADAEYRCDDNIGTVMESLGDGYTYSEGLSCAYDGLDKTYTYEVATFYTNPLPEGDLISMIYTEDASVTTSKGIAVGASKQDVIAAYGEGEDTGNMLVYRVPGEGERGSLCFDLDGDTVISIFVTTEPV